MGLETHGQLLTHLNIAKPVSSYGWEKHFVVISTACETNRLR